MDIDAILSKLTLEEKIALCSGQNFWMTKDLEAHGIPALFMCDGPHGLRKQEIKADGGGADMLGINDSVPATCFPTAVTTGASWDADLMERIGAAIGEEAKAYGVGLVLGPGANIKRNPLCGRNFEYISEDPYLAGKMAAALIRGLQKNGTGACLKHFACNNQELMRFTSDSVLDERTLREIYLTAFEIAVKEGRPATVMCAYNKVNGVHCSDSRELLTDILRGEWGFDGMVVTDWGAMNDRIEGFKAGCDLNMPGGSEYMEKEALEAVKSGSLSEADVDAAARRVLERMAQAAAALGQGVGAAVLEQDAGAAALGQDAGAAALGQSGGAARASKEKYDFDRDAHHSLAREAAEKGAVLLKNEGILPLSENRKIALIGAMAKAPRYQGAGSSHINPFRVASPLEAIPAGAVFAAGCDERGDTTDALLAEAADAAVQAEVAVVFAGLPDRYESEGFDRENMKMPEGHLRMIETVAQANPNTVVVLCCGSAVECPWADSVKAILYMGLGGQAMGEAVCDLLYGKASPSGRLTESWPLRYEDCVSSSYYGSSCGEAGKDAQYREGVYVGYRYYEKAEVPVRWPFGYGLSYTTFAYSNLIVEASPVEIAGGKSAGIPGAEVADTVGSYAAGRRVSVTVTNTGSLPGAEVVQLFVAAPENSGYRPVRELKGFRKVFLEPGESREIEFALDDRSFAVWQDGWRIPGGVYALQAGGLSVDVEIRGEQMEVRGEQAGIRGEEMEIRREQAGIRGEQAEIRGEEIELRRGDWYDAPQGAPSLETWEKLLGREYVAQKPVKGQYTMDNTVMEMMEHSLVMKIMYKATAMVIGKGFPKAQRTFDCPEYKMMMFASVGGPLRSMQVSSGIKGGLFQGLLEMANGHFFKGIWKMLKG